MVDKKKAAKAAAKAAARNAPRATATQKGGACGACARGGSKKSVKGVNAAEAHGNAFGAAPNAKALKKNFTSLSAQIDAFLAMH